MSVTPTQQYRLVVIRQAFGIWSFFSSNVPCVVPHWFAAVMRFFFAFFSSLLDDIACYI